MKKIACIILTICILLSLAACGSTPSASTGSAPSGSTSSAQAPAESAASETIKVGQLCALTGSSAPYGIPENNAAKLYIDKINAAGGVLGRQVELIAYDSKGDQSECVNATKRLIADGVCAIIGPNMSGQAIAIVPVTEAAGIPFIATAATNPKVTVDEATGNVFHTAFRTCFIDSFQGKVVSQFCLNELGGKTVAIIYDVGSDYAAGLKEYFEADFLASGGTIVATEGYRSGELDFRAILGKVKEKNPDIIFSLSAPNEGGLMIKQAHDLGIECEWISGDMWSDMNLVESAAGYAEGAFMISLAAVDDPSLKDWLAEYNKTFGADPILPAPIFVTDALNALFTAIEKAGSTDSEKIIEQLEAIENLPVLSGSLTFDPATHNPLNKPAIIQTVKDGQIVYYTLFENYT